MNPDSRQAAVVFYGTVVIVLATAAFLLWVAYVAP